MLLLPLCDGDDERDGGGDGDGGRGGGDGGDGGNLEPYCTTVAEQTHTFIILILLVYSNRK